MSEPHLPAHSLVGVYPADRRDQVLERMVAAGAERAEIRIDDAADERRSLRAEMHQEVTDSYVSPQVGVVYPKETTKAMAVTGPVIVAVATVLALPLAIFFPDSMPWWARLLTAAVCGATAGGTIAVLVIPAMSLKNPHEESAADRGVVVAIDRYSPEIEHAMAACEPIRLDKMGPDGVVIGAVTTEEDQADGGIVEELGQSFAREQRADPEHKTR